jgi:hypothetical protein
MWASLVTRHGWPGGVTYERVAGVTAGWAVGVTVEREGGVTVGWWYA